MSEQLMAFIQAQHETNLKLTEGMARCETMLKDNSQRMFGGDGQPGVLPKMYEKVEAVEKRVSAVESWKTGTLKWVGGVVAVLTLEGSAIAFYLNTVTQHTKAVEQALKVVAPH